MNGMSEFITRDSGKRAQFPTGMQRDTQEGKPRYGLIPVHELTRVAELYARGAVKYSDDNWKLGSSFSRTYDSLLRHIFAWAMGDRSEDHLAAVVFNTFCIMFYERKIEAGELDSSLNDMNIPLKMEQAYSETAAKMLPDIRKRGIFNRIKRFLSNRNK